jgi:hypothetical protein
MGWIQFIKPYSKILLLIGITILIYLLLKSKKEFENSLMNEGKLSIGTFESFSSSINNRGSGHSFKYKYINDVGELIKYTQLSKYPSKNVRKYVFEGDKFLILYNNDGSLMLFDKPIKDSTDFQLYVREFEEMRKNQNK